MTASTDPPASWEPRPSDVATAISGTLPFETAVPAPAGTRDPATPTVPLWRRPARLMVNPEPLLAGRLGRLSWGASLALPGLAFGLFFAQTGLDRLRAGTLTWFQALVLAGMGAAYGAAGLALLGVAGWFSLRLLGVRRRPDEVIQVFALAYGPTLVYVVLGLLANLLLGWPTAIAFGVPGVLWAMGPLMTSVRKMADGQTVVAVGVATVCGTVLLLGWAWLSGGMS